MPSSVPLSISVTCLPTEHLLVLLSGTGYLYIVTLSSGGQVPRGYGGCGHFVSGTDSGLVGWKPFAQQTTACAFSRRCDAVPCELIADLRMWPADSPTELAQPRVADPEVMTHLVNDRPPNLVDDLGIAVAHRADGTPVDRDPVRQGAGVERRPARQWHSLVEPQEAGRATVGLHSDGH